MSGRLAKADALAWLEAHVWSRQGHRGPLSFQHRRSKKASCVSGQTLASATVEALLPLVGLFCTTSLSVSLSASLAPPLTFYKPGTARCQHTAATTSSFLLGRCHRVITVVPKYNLRILLNTCRELPCG